MTFAEVGCSHERRQPVETYGGEVIAMICRACLDVVALRGCKACGAEMRIGQRSRQRRRLYCNQNCRARAFRKRRKEGAAS